MHAKKVQKNVHIFVSHIFLNIRGPLSQAGKKLSLKESPNVTNTTTGVSFCQNVKEVDTFYIFPEVVS